MKYVRVPGQARMHGHRRRDVRDPAGRRPRWHPCTPNPYARDLLPRAEAGARAARKHGHFVAAPREPLAKVSHMAFEAAHLGGVVGALEKYLHTAFRHVLAV